MRVAKIALAAFAAMALSQAFGAAAMPGGITTHETTLGVVFADAKGMTLYTYDPDDKAPGKSVCNGNCATNWPPVMAAADAAAMGDWTVITRDDGKKQWAYKGKPIYLYVNDK